MTDTDERAQLQELRDWVAAGNSPDSRWSALQSYDAVLAELPGLLVLLDGDDRCLRTRIAYLLAWFPEFSATSLPRLLALAAHEKDPVTAATALLASRPPRTMGCRLTRAHRSLRPAPAISGWTTGRIGRSEVLRY